MKRTLALFLKATGIVGVAGVVLLVALLWRERNQSLELKEFALGSRNRSA